MDSSVCYRFAFVYTGQKEMENLSWRCFICLGYISKRTIRDGKQQMNRPKDLIRVPRLVLRYRHLFCYWLYLTNQDQNSARPLNLCLGLGRAVAPVKTS